LAFHRAGVEIAENSHLWTDTAKDIPVFTQNNGRNSIRVFLMRKSMCMLLFLATAWACGGQLGDSSESNLRNFSIVIPEGWRELNSPEYLMITREGAFSQYILVQQRRVDKPFKHTEKKLNKYMLPKKAAEVIMDEISSDIRVLHFHLSEYVPIRVNQYNGFKIVYTYKEKGGLNFLTVFYGFLEGDWFYCLRYSVEVKKYTNEDIETFEKVLNSFKIKGAPSV
jgi:hypothetical protein